jgi:hypothetical protein
MGRAASAADPVADPVVVRLADLVALVDLAKLAKLAGRAAERPAAMPALA